MTMEGWGSSIWVEREEGVRAVKKRRKKKKKEEKRRRKKKKGNLNEEDCEIGRDIYRDSEIRCEERGLDASKKDEGR